MIAKLTAEENKEMGSDALPPGVGAMVNDGGGANAEAAERLAHEHARAHREAMADMQHRMTTLEADKATMARQIAVLEADKAQLQREANEAVLEAFEMRDRATALETTVRESTSKEVESQAKAFDLEEKINALVRCRKKSHGAHSM